MLNFEFTQEQNDIRTSVADWAKKNLSHSIIRKMDDEGRLPQAVLKDMAEMGLIAMTVSKEYGGIEADPVTVGVVAEALARADISCAIPTFFLVPAAWGYIFDRHARERIRKDFLPKVTAGRAFLGIAATEPDAGSDLANIRTVAKRNGSKFIVNGEKMFISGIEESMKHMPDGGGYAALFKTDPPKKTRGMTLFYLPVNKNAKGVSPTYLDDWGRRGISTGGIALSDVELPEENIIGKENEGFLRLVEGFDYARGIIAVICAGVAMSALEYAMDYIKMRKTFEKPIASHEGIQFTLAEHWARLEGVRLMGYKTLWLKKLENDGDTSLRFKVTKAASEAKMIAPKLAFDAINDALQWFGAFGYTKECPLDMALKGVRSYFWAEGALEIQKLIVARELLGKEFIK